VILAAIVLLSAGIAGAPAETPAAAPNLYRLELGGSAYIWAQDHPQTVGSSIVFHRYPDGALMSVKSADVKRISVSKLQPTSQQLAPGQQVDIGVTGGGGTSKVGAAPGAGSRGNVAQPGPGERNDGTALFNPNRAYRPDWDSKQVPGVNLGYPNSPNDYQEGRTLGYPSAASPQMAPGDLPRAKVETGDPKSNQ
jgi:hypothetical protein